MATGVVGTVIWIRPVTKFFFHNQTIPWASMRRQGDAVFCCCLTFVSYNYWFSLAVNFLCLHLTHS